MGEVGGTRPLEGTVERGRYIQSHLTRTPASPDRGRPKVGGYPSDTRPDDQTPRSSAQLAECVRMRMRATTHPSIHPCPKCLPGWPFGVGRGAPRMINHERPWLLSVTCSAAATVWSWVSRYGLYGVSPIHHPTSKLPTSRGIPAKTWNAWDGAGIPDVRAGRCCAFLLPLRSVDRNRTTLNETAETNDVRTQTTSTSAVYPFS